MQKKQRERTTIATLPLHCLECRRPWVEATERWRIYLSGEDPSQPLTYCPECAQREFG
jgi:hypothetical protein